MPDTSFHRVSARRTWLWLPLLLLGMATTVVAWTSLSLATASQHGWAALLAGLEMALMLRLGGMRPGWGRALLAAAATMLVIAAVQWGIASGHIGAQMGLSPFQAVPKMGLRYVLVLSQLANSGLDVLLLALAPLLALRAGR